ncbi:putative mediator of RNA polymerase II transcription subunit 12 [Drosophila navojoa]|uniref:putative mediator of RNA polymerase II transcription subunit 12 n=1 Tax=Drosophila navojoa TaxID=7232 RepID=UPI0011BD6F6A|nr:putative mediator of RNA polymerase II transcription subunit 12 [Drosophila navojoa]
MRLLLLSLLALGAHAHTIGYRTNLLAYAPARGEFPVQSEIVQGYTRYLDNTGAERLIAFNYPEPLYGIRTVAQPATSFVRTSAKVEPQQQQQQHLALFRAWCEQRYNALRVELERLRAEGKQPTANMLSQYEPLEQIIKMNAFEAVPGLSPELQRVRDEQMRIWNEARLKVINAEAALPQQTFVKQNIFTAQPFAKTEQPLVKQFAYTAQTNGPLESPKPVQETEEVKRAREEHLRRYNEALQQQQQQKQESLDWKPQPIQQQDQLQQEQLVKTIPIATEKQQKQESLDWKPQPIQQQEQLVKTIPIATEQQQQQQQAIEDTPEVQRAREEHLRRYNEALQQQQQQKQESLDWKPQPVQQQEQFQQQQQQQAIEDTPEVQRAREEHFKLYKEALLRQATEAQPQPQPQPQQPSYAPLPTSAPQAGVKTYDASSPGTYVSAQTPAQTLQTDNFNQVKVKAEDSSRYDEREQAAQLEEERREEIRLMELERQREEKRLMEERRMLEAERIALEQEEKQRMEAERLEEEQRQQAEQQQLKAASDEDSYKYAKPQAAQAAQPAQPAQPQTIAQQQQVQNGFFLRIQSGAPSQISAPSQPSAEAYFLAEHNPFLVRYAPQPQKAQQLSSPVSSTYSSGSSTNAFKSSTGLSEWEQATRDHFKAHEIALEQLRLANLKDANQIPCTH